MLKKVMLPLALFTIVLQPTIVFSHSDHYVLNIKTKNDENTMLDSMRISLSRHNGCNNLQSKLFVKNSWFTPVHISSTTIDTDKIERSVPPIIRGIFKPIKTITCIRVELTKTSHFTAVQIPVSWDNSAHHLVLNGIPNPANGSTLNLSDWSDDNQPSI